MLQSKKRFKSLCRLLIVICAILLVTSAQAQFPPVVVQGDYLVLNDGTNQRWFLSGIVDNTPTGGMQLTKYDHAEMETQIADLANMKCTGMRWNAFLKGLDFSWDANGYVDGFYSMGDPVAAIVDGLDLAQQYGIKVQIVLSTTHFLNYGFGGADQVIDGRISNKDRVANNKRMFSTTQGTQAYIDNILTPIAQAVGQHPALAGYLIINEAYGMTDSQDTPRGSWTDEFARLADLQRWVNKVAATVKQIQPGVLCSVSGLPECKTQYEDAALIAAGGESQGVMDFWQYNYYHDHHNDNDSPFLKTRQELVNLFGGSDKPAICGEFPIEGGDPGMNLAQSYENLWDNGFCGGWTWQFTAYYAKTAAEKADIAAAYTAFYNNHLADYLTVSPSTLSFLSDAGSDAVNINSNASWSVSDDASWISVNPTNGSGNGTVTVTVIENTGGVRSGTVTVSNASITRIISVNQEEADQGGTLATDGFESGNLSGGSGWGGAWSTASQVDVITSDGPSEGSNHVRLRTDGEITRTIDLSVQSSASISFEWKAKSLDNGDEKVEFSINDGASWTVLATLPDGQDNDVYKSENIDLSSYNLSSNFQVRFRLQGSGSWDFAYVDNISVTGSGSTANPPGIASNPNPANNATGVNTAADLTWTAGSGVTSHNVYFGTSNPPASQGSQSGTTYDPGTMAENTTYYWRVNEVNSNGTTTGPVWSFTTSAAVSHITAETENNGNSGSADGPVGNGVNVTGAISSGSDDDWFYFDVNTTGNINISVSHDAGADLDWWLYHESNLSSHLIRGYTTSNPEAGTHNATQTGRYYLEIKDYNNKISSYTLEITGGLAKFLNRAPEKMDDVIPSEFSLQQSWPNPFNPITEICYQLPEKAHVQLDVYNMIGQKIATLVNSQQSAGMHSVRWNALNDNGVHVPSGVYIYTIQVAGPSKTYTDLKKMLLVK